MRIAAAWMIFASWAIVLGDALPSAAGETRAAAEAMFHVSPDGSDNWSGKLAEPNGDRTDGPFASIDRARQAARAGKAGRWDVRPEGHPAREAAAGAQRTGLRQRAVQEPPVAGLCQSGGREDGLLSGQRRVELFGNRGQRFPTPLLCVDGGPKLRRWGRLAHGRPVRKRDLQGTRPIFSKGIFWKPGSSS